MAWRVGRNGGTAMPDSGGNAGAAMAAPHAGGRPTVDSDLTVESDLAVEGDLAGAGAVALRGAVAAPLLARLRDRAQVLFDLYDELTDSQLAALQAAQYRFHNALPYRLLDRRFEILQALHPAVTPLLQAHLGSTRLVLRNCILRRLRPESARTRASFHQDLQFLWPHDAPMATLWIPLDPCDGTRPGLQLLPRRLDRLAGSSRSERQAADPGFSDYADRGGDTAYDSGIALPDAAVAALAAGGPLWEPHLALGDALVFDGLTIHRSALHPGMTAERISVELRWTLPPRSGTSAPADHGASPGAAS